MYDKIVDWLYEYIVDNNLKTFVVGVSGGLDSAVTSTLCAMTGMKVIVVNMPIHQNEILDSLSDKHIEWLKKTFKNVESQKIDLTKTFDTFSFSFKEEDKDNLSLANSRARLRMATLYQISGANGGIVVGTGNKVEDFGVGFFTKYGDGGVDISPIADLMKTEVWEIAKELGISKEIIDAPPTDGLWDDGRTDEDQLGASYAEIEKAMIYAEENNLNEFEPTGNDSFDSILKTYFLHRNKNLHKMNAIPVYENKPTGIAAAFTEGHRKAMKPQ
jgi:NAD+ synthase